MARYAVVDDFRAGVPQTILSGGLRPRGIACHTTEGGEGEAGAISTLVNVLIANAARNASYHELWYAKAGGFEARRIVRPDRASHSMNPAQPPNGPWKPEARVRRVLGDRWWDPNASSYAVSIAGSTARTVPVLIRNDGFMTGAIRRVAELGRQFAASLAVDPLYNHGEGQTNRTDWGTAMRPALLEDFMRYLDSVIPIVNRRLTIRAGATARTSPAFDPADPTGNAIAVHENNTVRTGVAYVTGTPLPGNPDTTWVLADRWQRDGGVFYHRQDVIGSTPIEASADPVKVEQAFRSGRDRAIAAYTDGGTTAAKAVQP